MSAPLRRMLEVALALALLVLLAVHAQARPSFDCDEATSAAEHRICSDRELARLDRILALRYVRTRLAGQQGAEQAASQREWLARRDACGGDAACLKRAMLDRIAELSARPPKAAAIVPPLAAVGDIAGAAPPISPLRALDGDWEGQYSCDSIVDNRFSLSVAKDGANSISAIFRFDVPGKPGQSGRFKMRGNPEASDGGFTPAPSQWLDRPEGFRPVGLTGRGSANNLSLSGKLLGCGVSSFEAHRAGGIPGSDASAHAVEAAAADHGDKALALPPGFGGQIAAATTLKQQCDVLAAWGRKLTARPDAMTAPVDRLQREALPLFEDSVFAPVFGMSYLMTTPEQRRPVYYLLARDCPQRLKMRETGHYDLATPWSPMPEGSFGFAAVTAGLMDRHEAQSRVAAAVARLGALPETQPGLQELNQIDRAARPYSEKLDEQQRQSLPRAVAENRVRITNGMLRARIASIEDLPMTVANLDALSLLAADINASALPPDEQAKAARAAREKAREIVRSRIDDASARAPDVPATLAGLADLTRSLREVTVLAARPEVGPSGSGIPPGAEPIIERRRAIMADPAVRQSFQDAMLTASRSGAARAVGAAAATYLQRDEINGRSGDPSYRQAVEAALTRAEEERRNAVLGPDAGAGGASVADAGTESASSTGEPTGRDMLAAVERLTNGVNAGQDDVAGRCTRREFHNDPALALMCLGQAGSGGPMHARVASFHKQACEKADGRPGYVCDYSFSLDLATGRNMGVLGTMMQSVQNCTGRFVRTGSQWAIQERECN